MTAQKPHFVRLSAEQECAVVIGHKEAFDKDSLNNFQQWLLLNCDEIRSFSIKTCVDAWGSYPDNLDLKAADVWRVVTNVFSRLSALQSLFFCSFTDSASMSNLIAAAAAPTLKRLSLPDCSVLLHFSQTLADFLTSPRCGIESLSMKFARYEEPHDHLAVLARAIASNKTMKVINIDGIAAGDQGCVALADAIHKNATLTELRCFTKTVSWFDNVGRTVKLSSDWFRPSALHDTFARKIARALCKNTVIVTLSLPLLTCYQGYEISRFIRDNKTLRSFTFRVKPMTKFDHVFLVNDGTFNIQSAMNRNNWRERWRLVLHQTLLNTALGLIGTHGLILPVYILLWSVDFLPEMENVLEYLKINLINSVVASCSRIRAQRQTIATKKRRRLVCRSGTQNEDD